MAWWIWVIGGVLLLATELTFVSAEFYLLFVGAAAVVTGLATGLCPDCPIWASWSLFIVLALVSVKLFRRPLAERFRVTGIKPPAQALIGHVVSPETDLLPGHDGRVEFRGASWGIRNTGEQTIPAGGRARITAVDGLTLNIELEQAGN